MTLTIAVEKAFDKSKLTYKNVSKLGIKETSSIW